MTNRMLGGRLWRRAYLSRSTYKSWGTNN